MRACGGDQYYCPRGCTAPIPVRAGAYTADYTTQSCPPGTCGLNYVWCITALELELEREV